MRILKQIAAFFLVVGLAACGGGDGKFQKYDGPAITQIVVYKGAHKMQMFHGNKIVKIYDVSLGFAPTGHKQFEGDGKTPEGAYRIDRRNPNSRYHLSLGINYPNKADIAYAEAQGKEPGGDIFIHGKTGFGGKNIGDWTFGCIAVSDEEIEEIYAMVQDGTPIFIFP
ncbi:L,D-transpeptidase family protein [Pseudorhodobacter wandonensis]|jgi:murein L,D-transpeptidase YafK|uniref:L,D-transpeptidase family protein n=1 Tax=Pseudorhodobacter wandonensis TaxID=1120568 RepID=UPI00067B5B20|nr:L,D-transpeptidase family protein [Pseudorhodobacter wandonensis]